MQNKYRKRKERIKIFFRGKYTIFHRDIFNNYFAPWIITHVNNYGITETEYWAVKPPNFIPEIPWTK